MKTWDEMKALEGKRVRVWLDFQDHAYVEGVLRNLSEYGEARLEFADGQMTSCWPALDMEEL